MEFIVRRNFRHGGKLYLQGSKLNIPVLDGMMRINLNAGIIEEIKADKGNISNKNNTLLESRVNMLEIDSISNIEPTEPRKKRKYTKRTI